MKYRIIAILALVMIAIFAYKESKLVDLDEETFKAWASVYIANKGDTELLEKLASQLETRDNQVIANTALRAAEKIKNPHSKKYDDLPYSKDIYRIILLNNEIDNANTLFLPAYESRIDFLKSKTEKTKLYARLAKLYYEKSDTENYNRLIAKAFDTSLPLPALTSRESLAFALDIIVNFDDVENFFKYAPQTPESYSKNMIRFDMINSPKIMKELGNKLKDTDFKKNAKYSYSSVGHFARIGIDAKRLGEAKYDELIYRFRWHSLVFRPAWSIGKKNWNNTNRPILAYYGYLKKNESLYNYFRPLSISEEQLYDMRADYQKYIRYTSLIFLAMGETQTAIDLIKSIPEKDKRYNLLRKNLKHILKNDDGLEVLKNSGLL